MNLAPRPGLPDTPPDAAAAPAAMLAAAADVLALGLLLLSEQGRLRHANASGQALLAAGRWLRLRPDGVLEAGPDALAARALQQALGQAATGQRQWLRAPEGAGTSATATLVRLGATSRGDAAVLLLTVTDPAAPRDLGAYALHHALTPAETRVLDLLARGLDQAQVAAALGVSLATLRSHTAAVRRKTGHRRLSALLQAVARLPPLHRAPAPSSNGAEHRPSPP